MITLCWSVFVFQNICRWERKINLNFLANWVIKHKCREDSSMILSNGVWKKQEFLARYSQVHLQFFEPWHDIPLPDYSKEKFTSVFPANLRCASDRSESICFSLAFLFLRSLTFFRLYVFLQLVPSWCYFLTFQDIQRKDGSLYVICSSFAFLC